jgi:hypothetical protein
MTEIITGNILKSNQGRKSSFRVSSQNLKFATGQTREAAVRDCVVCSLPITLVEPFELKVFLSIA